MYWISFNSEALNNNCMKILFIYFSNVFPNESIPIYIPNLIWFDIPKCKCLSFSFQNVFWKCHLSFFGDTQIKNVLFEIIEKNFNKKLLIANLTNLRNWFWENLRQHPLQTISLHTSFHILSLKFPTLKHCTLYSLLLEKVKMLYFKSVHTCLVFL